MSNENSNNDNIKHLTYEIQMFYKMAKGIDLIERSKIPISNKDNVTKNVILENDTVKNALLESFTVHVRNIVNFLSCKKTKNDDITYKTFLGDEERFFINNAPYIEILIEKINKEIVHLTEYRGNHEKTQWFISPIVCELAPDIEKFMNEIENRKVDFDENYKKEIEDEIDDLEKSFCENESNENHSPVSTTT